MNFILWIEERTCCRYTGGQDIRPSNEGAKIQSSSVVERSAVNRLVVGSNPTSGAKPHAPLFRGRKGVPAAPQRYGTAQIKRGIFLASKIVRSAQHNNRRGSETMHLKSPVESRESCGNCTSPDDNRFLVIHIAISSLDSPAFLPSFQKLA